MAENTVKIKFHNHEVMKLTTKNNEAGDAIIEAIETLSSSKSDDIDEVEFNHGELFYYSNKEEKEE